jgi:hypothetical protein
VFQVAIYYCLYVAEESLGAVYWNEQAVLVHGDKSRAALWGNDG